MPSDGSLAAFDGGSSGETKVGYWDWDDGLTVPELTDKHRRFRQVLRKFYDEEISPHIDDWEEQGGFPRELHEKAYKAGAYGASWPGQYGGTSPTAEEWDPWCYYVANDEAGRVCAGGMFASLFTLGIGLPPIIALGTEEQKQKWVPDIIQGKKTVSLAITEPYGGSDVAGCRTTAKRDGDFFVVNGSKTFISGGMHADYFTTSVRTGGPGMAGISLLMIPRDTKGISTTRLKTQGWGSSTTTTVAFDDVRVPVANLLGKEGEGFKPIMRNFNNERLAMAVSATRMARECIEDAIDYAKTRQTFGKPLMSHQVIRHKLAEMIRTTMATHGMVLDTCRYYSMLHQGKGGSLEELGSRVALLKVQSTKNLEFVAREASQILGGRSYLRGGKGVRIERVYREVRVYAIGGGSEEIMLDLASRPGKL